MMECVNISSYKSFLASYIIDTQAENTFAGCIFEEDEASGCPSNSVQTATNSDGTVFCARKGYYGY